MKAPLLPVNESKRVETLRALNILDTSAEERFDRLTRLAKRLFGVPIALISLVDTDRQWFKSCQGLDASETPRNISFCGHAILADEVFVIEDALLDERFNDNPLVTGDPNIRFYAGFPLAVANGSKLGTLCVIDSQPRILTDEDRVLLKDLARMVEAEISTVQLATMDELTLLSNRRGFMALSAHALGVCKRLSKPAALFFIDMDGFKDINDRFGHAEGDRVLASFSELLRHTCREADVVGRLGGDEFVVFLTDASPDQSEMLINRLDKLVGEFNAREKRGYDIRYSIGRVVYNPSVHTSIDDMVAEADKRMYAQKFAKTGRSVHEVKSASG
jgi:diguanylate cyclase (GGDEF)-like protein